MKSKEKKIIALIIIDSIFFLLEIVLGYSAHSLALVADAFHMLNDVVSLFVGWWAVRVATNRAQSNEYTYGWARAEILGGLVNGVFLMALCLSIVLEAIQRFFEPQEVKNPKIVLIVGGIGLVFNIVALVVFSDTHAHGHGDDSHDHDHDHEHEHEHEGHDHIHAAEEGHSDHMHAIEEGTVRGAPGENNEGNEDSPALLKNTSRITWSDTTASEGQEPSKRRSISNASRRTGRHQRSSSRTYGIDDLPIIPGSMRDHFSAQARGDRNGSESDASEREDFGCGPNRSDGTEAQQGEASEATPLLGNATSSSGHSHGDDAHGANKKDQGRQRKGSKLHQEHIHRKPKPKSKKGGHSHADMNIRGIFLHALGDALGNVGVMASALIIWLTPWSFRFYFDPAISIVITLIILKSAIPLVKATSRPLLQGVPEEISVEDILEDICSLPGVRSCHHFHVWALTPSKLVATLDVQLDFDFQGSGAMRYMELANEIKKCLHEHGIHCSTIQPELCTHGNGQDAESSSSSNTIVNSGDSPVVAAPDAHASCTNGECLLDCEDGRGSCYPPEKPNSGSATPKSNHDNSQSSGEHHDHSHGPDHEHGKKK